MSLSSVVNVVVPLAKETNNSFSQFILDKLAVGTWKQRHLDSQTSQWFNQSDHEQDQTEEGEYRRFSQPVMRQLTFKCVTCQCRSLLQPVINSPVCPPALIDSSTAAAIFRFQKQKHTLFIHLCKIHTTFYATDGSDRCMHIFF